MGFAGAQLVGTPAFISPETLLRGTLDARADLFSLGATLYYALTGEPAHYARSFGEAADAWNSAPMPPSAHVDSISSSW
jgi:serine/threonine-protein kinase